MKEEYQDLIDDEDNVIGKATRKEVVEKALLHKGILVFVFNSEGKLFLQKRSKNKKLYPRFFSIGAGGGVNFGENYEEAAIRELEEELGIKNVKIEFLFDFKYRSDILNYNCKTYKCIYDGEITIEKDEIESGEFMTIDEVREINKKGLFCPDDAEMFEIYMKNEAIQNT